MNLPPKFIGSSLTTKLEAQKKENPNQKPICLFTDLDDTYILKYWPSEEVLEKNSQKFTDTILSPDLSLYEPTLKLRKFLDELNIPVVIVSGRDFHQLNELQHKFASTFPNNPEIMDFDVFIGAVGTEIIIKTESGYTRDTDYDQLMDKSLYDREKIYRILSDLIPKIREKFRPVAFDFCKRDQLDSTDELPKLAHKISYEFKAKEADAAKIEEAIRDELSREYPTTLAILVSSPYALGDGVRKYNVDIVPFSKEKPIMYLQEILDITSVIAGDSGNDYDMLAKTGDYSIIVGNAKNELLERLSALPEERKKHLVYSPKELHGPYAVMNSLEKIISGIK